MCDTTVLCVCVCVYVCERERESEWGRESCDRLSRGCMATPALFHTTNFRALEWNLKVSIVFKVIFWLKV